jgi:hypothetical protein
MGNFDRLLKPPPIEKPRRPVHVAPVHDAFGVKGVKCIDKDCKEFQGLTRA